MTIFYGICPYLNYIGIFHRILSFAHNTAMGLNDVMHISWQKGHFTTHGPRAVTTKTLLGENRRLVTNELVEFGKQLVEVQDFERVIDRFRGICRIYFN
jgi:hypothetical protein